MKNIPNYTEYIIVAVVFQKELSWYISDKEIWFLDYSKRISAFENKGYSINQEYIDESRKNFLILDKNNASDFLDMIKCDKVITQELRKSLFQKKNELDDSWRYDYKPSIYINFDKKIFYSNYSEPASYEEYVPNLWKSEYTNFESQIPLEKRYWIDETGKNLLETN